MTVKRKPGAFGISEGKAYAIRIDRLSDNDFMQLPFGRSIDDRRKIAGFIAECRRSFIDVKGNYNTIGKVRAWIRENKPAEYYATWFDNPRIKDDNIEIFYKEQRH